jgi:hypothetical protein
MVYFHVGGHDASRDDTLPSQNIADVSKLVGSCHGNYKYPNPQHHPNNKEDQQTTSLHSSFPNSVAKVAAKKDI